MTGVLKTISALQSHFISLKWDLIRLIRTDLPNLSLRRPLRTKASGRQSLGCLRLQRGMSWTVTSHTCAPGNTLCACLPCSWLGWARFLRCQFLEMEPTQFRPFTCLISQGEYSPPTGTTAPGFPDQRVGLCARWLSSRRGLGPCPVSLRLFFTTKRHGRFCYYRHRHPRISVHPLKAPHIP